MGETLNITLTSEMAAVIRERVSKGEYASSSHIMQEALQVWADRKSDEHEQMNTIRDRIRQSRDDTRPSEPMDEVFDRLEARFASMIDDEERR